MSWIYSHDAQLSVVVVFHFVCMFVCVYVSSVRLNKGRWGTDIIFKSRKINFETVPFAEPAQITQLTLKCMKGKEIKMIRNKGLF